MNWLKTICAKLVVPSGINPSYVADRAANMIASTIIHEATHGQRWAKLFYTRQIPLNQMNRSLEERMAEDAERAANLKHEIDANDATLYGNSPNETIMTNAELLSKAIAIANSKMNFYIPPDLVEDAQLSPEAQGQFEMVQDSVSRSTMSPNIAWREADRKLLIDVDKIVQNYNGALGSFKRQQPGSRPTTFQEGEDRLAPGYTQQSPLPGAQQGVSATPARQSTPAWGSR